MVLVIDVANNIQNHVSITKKNTDKISYLGQPLSGYVLGVTWQVVGVLFNDGWLVEHGTTRLPHHEWRGAGTSVGQQ